MTQQVSADRGDDLARAAARGLMANPKDAVSYEPATPSECHAAVDELNASFASGGETLREMVDNSRGGAEALSTDSFQGLSEIVQNANDAWATEISFTLTSNVLEVQHNGRPVDLKDLRAMSVPWLTTKSDVAEATGRFGVGLSTLHAIAETFEVHSGNYHVRIGDPFLTNLDADPRLDGHTSETVLRVVFREGAVSQSDFVRWWEGWDDSALIFLKHVQEVRFATANASRTLGLTVTPLADLVLDPPTEPFTTPINMSLVTAPDNRRWMLATCEVTSPPDVERARKRKGATTPLGVALPLSKKASGGGHVFAGLPVVGIPDIPALVNAQFDPVTARQGLLGTEWNFALATLVANLWELSIEELFVSRPRKAWRCVPLSSDVGQAQDSEDSRSKPHRRDLVGHLASLIQQRSNSLASSLVLHVDGERAAVTHLAVESRELTGVLTDEEVVTLSGTDFRLPDGARDDRGRWRAVFNHWRSQAMDLPDEVTVRQALQLLDNPVRAVPDVIRLTAVAIDANLDADLMQLHCIVDVEDRPHRPPSNTSAFVVTPSRDGLAADLGLAIPLHHDYLEDNLPATRVRQWLQESGLLIESGTDLPVLERLAAAGRADQTIEDPFDDQRLGRLRLALEQFDTVNLHRLGRDIGRAIFISGYEFDASGTPVNRPVRPCDAYLPKRIETVKDGFFTAAGQTPGLVWVAHRYADVLKSNLPRSEGLGAQKFLKALGVATTARVVPHSAAYQKYQSSERRGLASGHWEGIPEWRRALADRDADHTLDDWESPDLVGVLTNIASDTMPRRRRERANAMIEVLGRAWRDLADTIDVDTAYANYGWNPRGQMQAWWLWQGASIAWLDNSEGKATSPVRLRRRSTANIAVFGDTPETFLHKEVALTRPEVLNYLGVAAEPSTTDLIQRLRVLRENPSETNYAECATVYVALATRASDGTLGRTPKQLRQQLSERGGLVRTPTHWVSPDALLRGNAIFGNRRHFTPSIPGTEALWRFLAIPVPRTDDCLGVLSEISKTREPLTEGDEAIVLQTFRLLDTLVTPRRTDANSRRFDISNRVMKRLASLPLWTSQGWVTKRPIYAIQDPQLVDGIGQSLPTWTPGADPSQFRRLFALLKLTPLDSTHATTNHPGLAYLDDDATERFQRALQHFKADLVRNAPETERSLTVPWASLEAIEARVHPALEATVTLASGRSITIPMHAKFEPSQGALFLRDEDELDRVDGVGRALAALFAADERNLAYTWLAAVQNEREGQRAHALELASERGAREAQDAQDQMNRLRDLQTEVNDITRSKKSKSPRGTSKTSPPPADPDAAPNPPAPRKPRVLVDIDSLVVTTSEGEIVNESKTPVNKPRPGNKRETDAGDGKKPNQPVAPTEPDLTKPPPKPSTTYRAYSDEEKERLGLKAASRVLAGDSEALKDIRNQRNVGADATDELGRFYELKVFGTDEGDTITLQPSQIARAMANPDFFLVIVSNLEGEHARPKVRVIVDPLRQLSMTKESKVKFSGLQEARSLVFTLDPDLDIDA